MLGRVVGLLAQEALTNGGRWSAGYGSLAIRKLRRQWQREWLTAPPFTPAFDDAKAEFAALLKADDFALFEKVLVWFQAQHTIPSPIVLGNIKGVVEGMDNPAVADLLGWPSDFRAWGRLIDWIISEANSIFVRLVPRILEVFDGLAECFGEPENARSQAILEFANAWLLRLEKGEQRDLGRDDNSRLRQIACPFVAFSGSYPNFAKGLLSERSGVRTGAAQLMPT